MKMIATTASALFAACSLASAIFGAEPPAIEPTAEKKAPKAAATPVK
jgi:hypothetical protein